MAAGRPRAFDFDQALDRALEVFWRSGYEGATLPDLTRAMGINRPSLYAAFGNKEALFRKALDRYAEGPAAYVREALAEPTARAVVERLLAGTTDLMADPRNPRGCLMVQAALACGAATESDPPGAGRAAVGRGGRDPPAFRARASRGGPAGRRRPRRPGPLRRDADAGHGRPGRGRRRRRRAAPRGRRGAAGLADGAREKATRSAAAFGATALSPPDKWLLTLLVATQRVVNFVAVADKGNSTQEQRSQHPGELVMRVTALALALALVAPAAAAEPEKTPIDLGGEIDGRGLALAETDKPVYRVQLIAGVDRNGEGNGTLVLDVTPRKVDEFGIPETAPAAVVRLECSLKLVKKKKIARGPAGPPLVEVEYRLYEITGPKITSRLSLAIEGGNWAAARFLVSDKDGKGRVAVTVRERQRPLPPPCHPGCFPAGTPIHTPNGARPVEALRPGDTVTTVGPEGTAGQGKVASVFVTDNRLIEVRTEAGTLTTTATQPLALAAGGLRPAGELKPGDRIYTWDGRERRAVAVRSVTVTGRARVFNVVLGEPVLFVAAGFLARSKPPAVEEPKP